MTFRTTSDRFYHISLTVCQLVKEENVKIPVPNFFQHALQERETRSAALAMLSLHTADSCAITGPLYERWASYVVLGPVQCSLHPGCGGGSAGGSPAAGGMSASTSGS